MRFILSESQAKYLAEITSKEVTIEASETDTNPTDGQKEAGNYKMGHISVKGMKISIENPKGSYRRGKDANGNEWKTLMHNHYGYFSLSKGKDGDAVDVFIGPNVENFERVYVVDQNDEHGGFDESKVMLGFNSKKEAKNAYMSNYEEGWTGFRSITSVSLKLFKKWLYRGRKQRQPFSDYVEIKKKQLKESKETGNIETWYHGGTNHELFHNGVLWLTDSEEYAEQYASNNQFPVIYEVDIDVSKLNPTSVSERGDDFDPYLPGKPEIQEMLNDGFNCYEMYYDEDNAQGIALLTKEPIVNIRKRAISD